MKNKILFVDHITSIKLHPKRIENYYQYNNAIFLKVFGYKIFFRREGFYDIFGEFISRESLLTDNYHIENNILYFKPHICFNMDNGQNHFKYFENVDEMNNYLENQYFTSLKRI